MEFDLKEVTTLITIVGSAFSTITAIKVSANNTKKELEEIKGDIKTIFSDFVSKDTCNARHEKK